MSYNSSHLGVFEGDVDMLDEHLQLVSDGQHPVLVERLRSLTERLSPLLDMQKENGTVNHRLLGLMDRARSFVETEVQPLVLA